MKTTIEYQVKRNFQWVFCSYSTYLIDKMQSYKIRKRNLKNGPNWDNDDYKDRH